MSSLSLWEGDQLIRFEALIEKLTSAVEKLSVEMAHANPPRDLRGSGRTEADAPGSVPRVGEVGDSGAGVGAGAGERGTGVVSSSVREETPGAQLVPGEGRTPNVLDSRTLARQIIYTIAADLRKPPFDPDKRVEDMVPQLCEQVDSLISKATLPLKAECARLKQLAESETRTAEMYARAWEREIGPPYRAKAHHIDCLVLTTQDRIRELTKWRALEARGILCFNCGKPHRTAACDQPEVNP